MEGGRVGCEEAKEKGASRCLIGGETEADLCLLGVGNFGDTESG